MIIIIVIEVRIIAITITPRAKETCWFWKNGNCKYLNRCKKDHPERCKDMIETGLCKNNRCKLIHPKICKNQFYKG